MEQQIQDLINSIKKDGIENATNESKRIIEEAQKKADEIINAAKAERDKLISDAEKEIAREKANYTESLKMAARDLSLSFKKDTEAKFQAILDEKVKGSFDESLLKELIAAVVKAEFDSDVTIVLPSDRKEALSSSLAKELGKELERGVAITFSNSFNGGFKVMDKDGKAYIDLSDDEVTKLLYPYISEAVRALI